MSGPAWSSCDYYRGGEHCTEVWRNCALIGEPKCITDEPDIARCYIHNVDEPYTEGVDYKACGECWHVWPTEADFLADVARVAREIWTDDTETVEAISALPADEIHHCPLCAHDF